MTPRRHLGLRGVSLRAGWVPALASLATASAAAGLVIGTDPAHAWVTARLVLAGLAVLLVAVLAGSERLVGLASLPLLGGALLGATGVEPVAWGRAIVVGCLWYVAAELAWASIEQRTGARQSPAVMLTRLREVSAVVVVAVAASLGGVAAMAAAPERTALVRGVVIGAIVLALHAAARHVARTGPPAPGAG